MWSWFRGGGWGEELEMSCNNDLLHGLLEVGNKEQHSNLDIRNKLARQL